MTRMSKPLAIVGLIIVATCVFAITVGTYKKIKDKETAREKMSQVNVLPLVNLDSLPFVKKSKSKPSILIFFNPQCDHCQYQAKSVRDTISAFQGFDIVWASASNIKDIKLFSETMNLSKVDRISFVKIDRERVFETFGSVSVPHIFIYSEAGQLVKEFKGQTHPKKILSVLK